VAGGNAGSGVRDADETGETVNGTPLWLHAQVADYLEPTPADDGNSAFADAAADEVFSHQPPQQQQHDLGFGSDDDSAREMQPVTGVWCFGNGCERLLACVRVWVTTR
jgi:hypothetical protein